MNKNLSLSNFSKGKLLSKVPKNITTVHLVLMVIGVILLGLTIYFAVAYFSAASDRNDVNKQITDKQNQINAIGGMQNIGALQSQLEQAQEDVIEQSPFPQVIHNTDVAYAVIQAAKAAAIGCFTFSPSDPVSFDINGRSYFKNSYSISVQGTTDTTGEKIARLCNFYEELESVYDTAILDSLGLTDGDGDKEWTTGFSYVILSLEEDE